MSDLRHWVSREGEVIGPEFLRVDGFLNHRIAPVFVEEAGQQLAEQFRGNGVTCVLTAEAAGNVIAYEVARRLNARALYAKKGRAATMAAPLTREIRSPTKGMVTDLAVSRKYLSPDDHVLVVDDFLYQGTTSAALAEMIVESGAGLVGFGFVIEKRFANGRATLERFGVPIVSLIPITRMDPATGTIEFAE
jgi:xanthine phosphoribosyltransferase